jgi:hypothetical protein
MITQHKTQVPKGSPDRSFGPGRNAFPTLPARERQHAREAGQEIYGPPMRPPSLATSSMEITVLLRRYYGGDLSLCFAAEQNTMMSRRVIAS